MNDIAKQLSNKGYEVKVQFDPIGGGTGTYTIYVVTEDGNKKLVYSKDHKHTAEGVIISPTPSKVANDILNAIISL